MLLPLIKPMFNRIKTLASLHRELGLRWSAFRLAYALRLRSGLIRLQTPQYQWSDRPLGHWLKAGIPTDARAYAEWRKTNAPEFFPSAGARSPRPDYGHSAIEEADKLLNGELKYFSHEYHQTKFPPNWHRDPVTDNELDFKKHWSQISDDRVIARRAKPDDEETASARSASQRHIDIKFVWESNRFAFVYALVRAHAAERDEKYAGAFWRLIEDWAQRNPPNTGPNWMDGQEIALRLMAWTFGFHQFSNSPPAAPRQIAQFTMYVAAQAERIYKNIGYAISTRSNHTISEAFGLWMVGLLFPELKHAEKYLALGKQLLEQEARNQIFPDGSYSMYSLNYHRFILHIYLYMIRLSQLNQSPISSLVLQKVASSITYLSRLVNPETGEMPVYGSNDGALVLPLNNCDFTDYRPLLQLGSVVTTGQPIFEPGDWDEDIFWLCGEQALIRFDKLSASPNPSPKGRRESESPSPFERGARGEGETSFPHGGIYLLHNANSRAFIRCTDFTSRPSHADQLHVDLWMRGYNIACDAGTYLYSGAGPWCNGLARTSAHNTVSVDGKDQMTMVSRFTWTNWAKGRVLEHTDKLWQGEHDGYKPVRHSRTVMALEGDRWLVIDDLEADEPHRYALHWLLGDFPFEQKENMVLLDLGGMKYKVQTGTAAGGAEFSILRADPHSTRGWRSRYYGHKEPAISLLLEARQPRLRFWTFFGFEGDAVEMSGEILRVSGTAINPADR
jgi:asparagine synthase (glutamine-hydrolysing)